MRRPTMKREEREALWSAVDGLVRRHRAFASADWALPNDEVDKLAEIADRLKPTDRVEAHKWLFDTHQPDLGGERGEVAERMEDVANAREDAIREILESGGVDDVLRLARSVKLPGFMGAGLAAAASTELDDRIVGLLDSEDQHLRLLAYSY